MSKWIKCTVAARKVLMIECEDDDIDPTLDAFVERIRADERAACVSKSAESETQTGLSIVDGIQAERDVLLAMVDFPPHPEILARWKLGCERYEKARKLNSLQWDVLCRFNTAGQRFDDMIDALPTAYSAFSSAPEAPTDKPERKPMTEAQIDELVWQQQLEGFDLVRATEAVHGITGESS